MSPRFTLDPQRLSELCRRRHIRRLALFGSVLREDFGPANDIDVLVEFEPGHVPGFAFSDIEVELAALDLLWQIVSVDLPALVAALESAQSDPK
jgi:uncharacterized protein